MKNKSFEGNIYCTKTITILVFYLCIMRTPCITLNHHSSVITHQSSLSLVKLNIR